MEGKKLKEYLKRLYEIEKILYEEELVKKGLEYQLNEPAYYKDFKRMEYSGNDHFVKWALPLSLIGIIATITSIVAAIYTGNAWVWYAAIMIFIILGILSFPTCFICFILIPDVIREKIENRRKEKENIHIKNMNDTIKINWDKKRKSIRTQLIVVNDVLANTKRLREKYYSLGIIHPKYRNLVAISSIYDYIDTERCYSLTGPHGAYDTYEYMKELGHIKTNLSIIIEQLDDIKHNQAKLFNALEESNRMSKKMLAGLGNVEKRMIQANQSLEDVAQYQRQTAEYNRITAFNTEYLKWVEIEARQK